MQNFFRDQPESIYKVNLIGEVATFIQHYYGNINCNNVKLVVQVLKTLMEVCVVCSGGTTALMTLHFAIYL